MATKPQFFFNDSTTAIQEAYNQREQGSKVAVGRDVSSGKWYVRIIGRLEPRRA